MLLYAIDIRKFMKQWTDWEKILKISTCLQQRLQHADHKKKKKAYKWVKSKKKKRRRKKGEVGRKMYGRCE